MRVLFVVASLCGLSLAGCAAIPVPSAPAPSPSQGMASAAASASTARKSPSPDANRAVIRYVALGDSYTIGTSVKPRERWPNQLTRTLNPTGDIELVANLAVNGASSGDVIDHQLPALDDLHSDLISLLIGVNDVVRGADVEAYRTNLRAIFGVLEDHVPAERILLVTIPDYTLTPQGAQFGEPARQSARIRAFNQALEREAEARQLLVVDISGVSDLVSGDGSLVADDGLHPSGKQYAGWVELIAPQVRRMLEQTPTEP